MLPDHRKHVVLYLFFYDLKHSKIILHFPSLIVVYLFSFGSKITGNTFKTHVQNRLDIFKNTYFFVVAVDDQKTFKYEKSYIQKYEDEEMRKWEGQSLRKKNRK